MFKLVIFVAFLSQVLANKEAIVKLEGMSEVKGTVKFSKCDGFVEVTVDISGLKPLKKHGFHIHQFGDITNGCLSTGPHFNPNSKKHGAPNAMERHVGDLGNVEADFYGVAKITFKDSLIDLEGENSIIGRGVVVHAEEDDLGLGNHKDSLTTGNAGPRLACGVIGVLRDSGSNSVVNKAVEMFTLMLVSTGMSLLSMFN